jgi:hypothetical protein
MHNLTLHDWLGIAILVVLVLAFIAYQKSDA